MSSGPKHRRCTIARDWANVLDLLLGLTDSGSRRKVSPSGSAFTVSWTISSSSIVTSHTFGARFSYDQRWLVFEQVPADEEILTGGPFSKTCERIKANLIMLDWLQTVNSIALEHRLLFILDFQHEIDITPKTIWQPLDTIAVRSTFHDGYSSRSRFRKVLLRSDTTSYVPRCQDTRHELGWKYFGRKGPVVVIIENPQFFANQKKIITIIANLVVLENDPAS